MSHHHFFTGFSDPFPTASSSFASHGAAPGTFIAAQRNGFSANSPSRFHGQVFMQRPHIAPPSVVIR